MSEVTSPRLYKIFSALVAKRWLVVTIFALLLGPSIYFALRVKQDNSVHRLIVESDPEYQAARAFEKVFGGGEYIVIVAEADDLYSAPVLSAIDSLERSLAAIAKVQTNSALTIYRRAQAGFSAEATQIAAFKKFALGSRVLQRQGLVGEKQLAIALVLDVQDSASREKLLGAVDRVLAPREKNLGPLSALRKVGQPYVNAYLDADMRATGFRYFPLFGLFVVVLVLSLYRSFRAVAAFLVALAVNIAMIMGYIGLTGGLLTIVSALVPMTILITCTATLVYVHSRFIEQPAGTDRWQYQLQALTNKFLPCAASIFAAAVGFAALAVSKIRPIREMGINVAVGLLFTFFIVFTLFPALQRIFNTPTRLERQLAHPWFEKFCDWLPRHTYRWRWFYVLGALVLSLSGVVALFGLPGTPIKPLHLETNAVEYINHSSRLYQDTKLFERTSAGLSLSEIWIRGPLGSFAEPAVLRGLYRFQESLSAQADVGSVIGLPAILQTIRYIGGQGESFPTSDEELEEMADQMEALIPSEPMIRKFVDFPSFSQSHLTVITRANDYQGFLRLNQTINKHWQDAVKSEPQLGELNIQIVGIAPLLAKIAFHLVPTLTESFGLTVAIIFCTFLLIFRNGAARLMAMIPSLFAILLMFTFMRSTGIFLNVATILIASTVLGATENDQIHFFYHLQEKNGLLDFEGRLRHSLLIAGRAIFFATLINAGGFIAFAIADLPPIRQFGLLTALSFVLSMIADFTALPAALWIVYKQKPASKSKTS